MRQAHPPGTVSLQRALASPSSGNPEALIHEALKPYKSSSNRPLPMISCCPWVLRWCASSVTRDSLQELLRSVRSAFRVEGKGFGEVTLSPKPYTSSSLGCRVEVQLDTAPLGFVLIFEMHASCCMHHSVL